MEKETWKKREHKGYKGNKSREAGFLRRRDAGEISKDYTTLGTSFK